jgi:inosine-uridine nucleoside N-ribohydrolase
VEKILLDTDIGSDLDDSMCLAYLLAQPQCQLLGITTVSGDTVKRAQLASVLCKVAGKHVPIHAGASNPLIIPDKQPHVGQAFALKRWEHAAKIPKGEAVEFMRQVIRRHPHEVTLLAIGPMTNVALLFSADPEIPSLLKELVIMGGVFDSGLLTCLSEWNMRCDPHAAAIVFKARVPRHRSIGLDVTFKVQMTVSEVKRRFSKPLLLPVRDFGKLRFKSKNSLVFHDPLAGAVIFDPKICVYQKGLVDVELQSKPLEGLTAWSHPKDKNDAVHEVATSVNRARFFKHYFSVF